MKSWAGPGNKVIVVAQWRPHHTCCTTFNEKRLWRNNGSVTSLLYISTKLVCMTSNYMVWSTSSGHWTEASNTCFTIMWLCILQEMYSCKHNNVITVTWCGCIWPWLDTGCLPTQITCTCKLVWYFISTSQTFKHSNPLMSSAGSHSQSVSSSVAITSICSLLVFFTHGQACVIVSTLQTSW